jgi:hypothetical protein
MAQALHFAYGVDETFSFEIAPKLDIAEKQISHIGLIITN